MAQARCVCIMAGKEIQRSLSSLEFLSSNEGSITNQIVKLTVDVCFCVISPWKEKSEVR